VITCGEAVVKVFSRRRRQPSPGSGLHQCALCQSDFVVPVEAEALDEGRWDMRLRCGQCGTYRDVVVSDEVAKRYDLDLNRGMAEIAAALEHDLIDDGDFASS
jgi:hypothetical protein